MIYLDSHSTTPVDPRVLKKMLPYFTKRFGNPSSRTHAAGEEARRAVERARSQVAKLCGADPREIVFTSGATESNNLALKGAAEANHDRGMRLVSSAIEHSSVLDPLKRLEAAGFPVTLVAPEHDGAVDLAALERAIRPGTVLVSLMLANNETGVIQHVKRAAEIAHSKGALFHCDAAQGLGRLRVNVRELGADLASFSSHKLYGPKGVGALYVRKTEPRVKLIPLFDGGGHETGMRSGTLNVPGIVGFGEACAIAGGALAAETRRIEDLRNRLLKKIVTEVGCRVNGTLQGRLAHNLNVSFEGVNSADLLPLLKGVAVSTGSACLSSSPEPSHVLKAMGIPEPLRHGAVRFGLGRFTTASDVDRAAHLVVAAVRKLRKSPRN